MKKDYRQLQSEKLFQKEYALLPETVYYVDLMKQNTELEGEINGLVTQIRILEKRITNARRSLEENRAEIYGNKPPKYVPETNGPCPNGDCRGFIMRVDNTCGVCKTVMCKECREIKRDIHICDPQNIESAKLIAKDSKPCPKCAVFIFKIDGCDQMWCSSCKTAFSWKTGIIEMGRIHNPHYYDWLRTENVREIPREPEDCNFPRLHPIYYQTIIRSFKYASDKISEIFTSVSHVLGDTIPRLTEIVDEKSNNKHLRIRYLTGDTTESEFKADLERRFRMSRKMSSVIECLKLFTDVMTDSITSLFNKCYRFDATESDLEAFFNDYKRICRFTNENLDKVQQTHACSFQRYKIKTT